MRGYLPWRVEGGGWREVRQPLHTSPSFVLGRQPLKTSSSLAGAWSLLSAPSFLPEEPSSCLLFMSVKRAIPPGSFLSLVLATALRHTWEDSDHHRGYRRAETPQAGGGLPVLSMFLSVNSPRPPSLAPISPGSHWPRLPRSSRWPRKQHLPE